MPSMGNPYAAMLVTVLRDEPDFSALSSSQSWSELQVAAEKLRMTALLAHAVRKYASSEQRAWCDEVLVAAWRRHDAEIRRLDRVLGVFEAAGVEVLALKGPILGRRHFEPPFLRRTSVDIDLAVRDRDLERAVSCLAAEGYAPTMSIRDTRRTSHHLEMVHPKMPPVELHTRLSKMSLRVPVEGLFDRAVEHQLPTGRTARIPNDVDELLSLLIHLAGDRFGSFFHLYELRRIWRAASPKLRSEVLDQMVQHRLAATVWLTETALRVYWNERFLDKSESVPRTWLKERLTPQFLGRLEANVADKGRRSLRKRLQGRWFDLHLTDSGLDGLRHLLLVGQVGLRETVHAALAKPNRP